MAEDDKVMVELEIPEDQVSIRAAQATQKNHVQPDAPQTGLKEELEKTRQELKSVKKERNELQKEKQQAESEPLTIREAVAKEIDPTVEGPVKEVTGYELGELITAPLHPPEHAAKSRPVYGQIRSLIIGFALMPVALIALLIFNGTVAISVALVGAALIALGVLVRI
jgi:hypothetical protein